jgi:hypothetical protein
MLTHDEWVSIMRARFLQLPAEQQELFLQHLFQVSKDTKVVISHNPAPDPAPYYQQPVLRVVK